MGAPGDVFTGRTVDTAVHTLDLLSVAVGNALSYYQCLANTTRLNRNFL